MGARLGRFADLHDVLRVEHEPVLVERLLQLLDPLHLALALGQLVVLGVVDLDAVAALVLGHVAGGVGGAQHLGQAEQAVLDVHQADAHADAEAPVRPGEVEVGDGLAQLVRDALGGIRRTVLQQHAELVAAQARERVAFAQAVPEQSRHLAHELVAGGVPAGVVDDLELVQVEIQHGVVAPHLRGRMQREPQPGARTRVRLIRPVSASWLAW